MHLTIIILHLNEFHSLVFIIFVQSQIEIYKVTAMYGTPVAF